MFTYDSLIKLSNESDLSLLDLRLPNRLSLRAVSRYDPKFSMTGSQQDAVFHQVKAAAPALFSGIPGIKATLLLLLKQPLWLIAKQERFFRGIQTAMRLGFEEETDEVFRFICRWWVLSTHNIIEHKTTNQVGKMWKSFTKAIFDEASDNLVIGRRLLDLSPYPRIPEGTWLDKLSSKAELDDFEINLCYLLTSTRVLPCGDWQTQEEALYKHIETLSEPPDEFNGSEEVQFRAAAYSAAADIRDKLSDRKLDFLGQQNAHMSISNSSCFESTRDTGGRRQFVLASVDEWLDEIQVEDNEVPTPLGFPYFERIGKTRRETVHPIGMDDAPVVPRKKSDGLFTESFQGTESERVGFQHFCWSFASLVKSDVLDSEGDLKDHFPEISRVAIGEPGNKVRVATKSRGDLVTYGQPWGHAMKELLSRDDSLAAGLGAASQGFEWLKRISKSFDTVPEYIMTGDFEEATDHMIWKRVRIAFDILFEVLGITSGYAKSYLNLLTSPRMIVNKDGTENLTCRAILMGEPGAKVVLTLMTKVANKLTGSPGVCFNTAGDDQIDANGSLPILLGYANATRLTSLVPGTWGISRRFSKYCEELLIPGKRLRRTIEDGSEVLDLTQGKIDAVKPRLASPEQKSGKGDASTNPTYGKARDIASAAEWATFPFITNKLMVLFLRNMKGYLSATSSLWLPREWGGLGLPMIRYAELWPHLSPERKALVLKREEGDTVCSNRLALWATTASMRGLETEKSDAFQTYTFLLENSVELHTVAELVALGVIEDIPHERHISKKKKLKELGFKPLNDVVSDIIKASEWQSYWDPKMPVGRGFKPHDPMSKRDERLDSLAAELCGEQAVSDALSAPFPGPPRWVEGKLINVKDLFLHEVWNEETQQHDAEMLPLVGRLDAGPRVFLHLKNGELLGIGTGTT
jgi:hypothetical protein